MSMPNMQAMMQKVQEMQEKMAKAQAELENRTVTAESGGGMVKAVVTGKQRLVSLTIDKDVIDPADPEMLEDLIVAAVNKGIADSLQMAEQEIGKATAGIIPNIPGLNLPGF